MKVGDEITRKVSGCQKCGLVGGVVLCWSENGASHATWCCPRCVSAAMSRADHVSLPRPVVQRTIAALEDAWEYAVVADQLEIRAILDELRPKAEAE